MATTTHTPTPWRVDADEPNTIHGPRFGLATIDSDGANEEDIANAARIVKCVNACAGIENPAWAIPVARVVLERVQTMARDGLIGGPAMAFILGDVERVLGALGKPA